MISVYLEPKTPERDGRILHRAVAGKPVDANRADAAGPCCIVLERITDTEMMASGIAQALDWMPVQPDVVAHTRIWPP